VQSSRKDAAGYCCLRILVRVIIAAIYKLGVGTNDNEKGRLISNMAMSQRKGKLVHRFLNPIAFATRQLDCY
jgi:hypothetical protein